MSKIMKIAAVSVAMCLAVGCGESKTIRGKTYAPYGLMNKDEERDQCIAYEIVTSNVVWSVLLAGSIVMPVYTALFELYQPVGEKACKDTEAAQ